MEEKKIVIKNEEETKKFGEKLCEKLTAGSIVALTGDLGTGKTTLTKAIAAGLGVTDVITSPTFNIVKQYDSGRLPLYHFDVYRIGDISEMDEIGYEDCFYGSGVSLIVWSELIEELLPERAVHVTIEKDLERGFDYRRIRVEGLE